MQSWDDLKYVLYVQRHGGLSAAARSLGVNHTTVSRRISSLEKQMGVRLFDRLPTGLKVTSHGERCVESAKEIERHVLELDVSIAAKDIQLAGPLTISAPQLIVQIHLADIATKFKEVYPQIDLTLMATTDTVNLHRREADVSIRAINEPDNSLWGRKAFSQNCMYYGAETYLNRMQGSMGLDCINFIWRGDEPAEEVIKPYPQSKVIAKFDDMVAVLGAVTAGMGIARMPCFIGDSQPGLARVPNIPAAPYFDIWILTHPDLKDVPRIKTFMRFAADELKKREHLFHGD
ncbi:LysR family transcriptional regulator [Terasakiella sp. A23]|uniref:LysR family transcriptional regulator n=1 Tax=Terasakiella sp. FCG-A23 TaxID=3080561 RepID=UPI002953E6F2|nr:LysR family transcriptional regulator [Terasakiella sp. A23]MDV7341117.1 LysR family transcriptional regulator [Terasakiella sp. A23]